MYTFLGRSSICKGVNRFAKLHVSVISGESQPQFMHILLVVAKLRFKVCQQLDFKKSLSGDKPVGCTSARPEIGVNFSKDGLRYPRAFPSVMDKFESIKGKKQKVSQNRGHL